jgi:hypothetical protein
MLPKTFNTLSILAHISLGLTLLISLCLATGILARPAHAQTTFTVTDCSDDTQLQADVSQANSDNAGDTITFACSGGIALTSTLNINGNMTIDGSGQTVTFGEGSGIRDLSVASGVTFTLNALTISGSSSPSGGGLVNNGGTVTITNSTFSYNYAGSSGGGILNSGGTLTITNSTFYNNWALFGRGGALNNSDGTVTITNSIFNSNFAYNNSNAHGAGIYNSDGTLKVIDSTFIGNLADGNGSAIYNIGQGNTGIVNITNSSFVDNTALIDGGGLYTQYGSVSITSSSFYQNRGGSSGNGLYISGKVYISESIIADSSSGDCAGLAAPIDLGYNLESGTSCGFTGTGDLQNTNPMFSTGQNSNLILQQGSPAIDTVPLANCPSTDQLGNPRPDDPSESSCDMGAYESSYPPTADSDLGLSNMPGNITTNATSSQGATVTYTSPTATDESGDNPGPAVNCTPASGSVFPIGTTTVTCTATDSDDSNSPVSQTFTVTVNDTDLALNGIPSNITTNATSSQGATVTYTSPTVVDEDNPAPAANCTPASGSVFPIGTTTVNCSATDSDDTPGMASGSFSVTVQPALSVTGTTVSATEGSAFNGVIASGNAYGITGSLTASITWGDGKSSTLNVTPASDGSYSVSASHTYVEEGQDTISITVSDSNGHSASTTDTATVSDAALTLKLFAVSPVKHLTAGLAGLFTDADPAGSVSDYQATVNWGDGTTSTVTVVKIHLGSRFVLAAAHNYAKAGTYTVTLTVTDQGGSKLTKTANVTVK